MSGANGLHFRIRICRFYALKRAFLPLISLVDPHNVSVAICLRGEPLKVRHRLHEKWRQDHLRDQVFRERTTHGQARLHQFKHRSRLGEGRPHESRQNFVITDPKGTVYTGAIRHDQKTKDLTILGSDTTKLPNLSVIQIEELGESFWKRMRGNIDLGLSFAKSNDQKNISLQSGLYYQSREHLLSGFQLAVHQPAKDGTTPTKPTSKPPSTNNCANQLVLRRYRQLS